MIGEVPFYSCFFNIFIVKIVVSINIVYYMN